MNKNLYLSLMTSVLVVCMFISFRVSQTNQSERTSNIQPNLMQSDRQQFSKRNKIFLDSLNEVHPDFLKRAGM